MRYVLSILVLLFSVSFFVASCGGDDTSNDNKTTYTCSPTTPNGTCADGKTCDNGICVDNNCTPSCTGKVCGSDGCGGTCGTCNTGETCSADQTKCEVGTCTPDCSGKTCGNDGCGGTCGTCNTGETCNAAGSCETGTCTPQCTGKVCGADGCGGSCGSCATGETCNAAGTCDAAAADGELGGLCGGAGQVACIDTTNGCLSAEGDANGTCYESCNGENDTCTQYNYRCLAIQSGEFFCFPSCTVDADCSDDGSAVCDTATGDCKLASTDCDIVTSSGCDAGKACYPQQNDGNICYPAGAGTVGQACTYLNDCTLGLVCVGDGTTNSCQVLCDDTNACASGSCTKFSGETYGFCTPAGTVEVGGVCDADNLCVDAAVCILAQQGDTSGTCYATCDTSNPNCGVNETCESVDADTAICAPAQ